MPEVRKFKLRAKTDFTPSESKEKQEGEMPGVLTQQQQLLSPGGKVNSLGIEVAQGPTWQGWEPGREYTKDIKLRNVRVKTQKLKYKVPSSRFFSTLYPQPIVLSAGTSYTLPVTFRPLEKKVYEDYIDFCTNEGEFRIPIRAVLPQVEIQVPDHIVFNMCAAQDQVQLTFTLKNVSELVTPFLVECDAPFVIEPADGVLNPFGSATLTATFKPMAAKVYEAEAMIKYGPDFTNFKVTQLEGISKYPHLIVGSGGKQAESNPSLEAEINFGEVSVGSTAEKWIELHNLSPVNSPFVVEHPTALNRIDTVFQCLQTRGIVPANSSVRIPVVFSPNTVGTKSIDYFHVKAIGNFSKTVVKCVATSKGPTIHLSQSAVNFLQIDSGQSATRTLEIVNSSDVEATWQFMIDCNESVFKFDTTSGVLAPNTKRTLVLKFEPVHPINYHRRVPCMVHNQAPLYVDLLGTCHTETAKPAVLQAKHLERYKLHVDRGLSFTPPEQLNEMRQSGQLILDTKGALMSKDSENGEVIPPPLNPMDEYFNDGYHTDITNQPPHVSMDIHEADFGQCTDMRLIQTQTVNLTNHTKGKITVVWNGGAGHVFAVSPATMDIPPLGSSPFTVTFKPTAPNQFFGAELECYVYYKSLRDYRLVEDTTHCPPWCLTLTAIANTFKPNNETFLPRFMLDTNKVVFPAVNTHEATYRTLLLSNTGTTPINFDFEKDNTGIFSMKPTKGLLYPGHQVFCVKILPDIVKTYKHILRLKLNYDEKNTQEITAWGSAEVADVLLDNNATMYFKPTCIGTSSDRQYSVTNISRIPLRYEWKMSHAESQILKVTPDNGVIFPNEKQFHQWKFEPKEQKKEVLKPCLVVWGQGQSSTSSTGKKRQFFIRVVGEGSIGVLTAEQSDLDFGNVVVGSVASRQLILANDSDCDLLFSLKVLQKVSGPYSDETESRYSQLALTLDTERDMLPARSRKTVVATVRPAHRVEYEFSLHYQLITENTALMPLNRHDGGFGHEDENFHQICTMAVTGVFPTLAVTDARCYGSAMDMSKKQLWALFSLDSLNVSLDADPSTSELMYNMATRHSHRRRPPVHTRSILDFNFGAAPVESEDCIVQLMLENTGTVSTEWSFMFPSDLQLELEYWAETGEFDDDELHEMKVMDNKLFSVEPRNGKLEPGECKTITFKYQHVMAGTDRLPVLLKLHQGREILLNFIGVTVDPERRYIHFPSSKHMFSPVAIGDKDSPKQMYELHNGGALPVRYELECMPLEIVKQENFDHEIFKCVNPVGEILPGQTAHISWIFSPLEAKTYMVDIPIRIHNGDTAVVTFTGVGYDKRVMGDTMKLSDQLTELSGVPSVQSVPVPGQLAYLSQERVSFGNVPLFSRTRRMVVMTNKSSDHPVRFSWHVTSNKDTQFVSVSPSSGTLQPGEATVCKVTFIACGLPSFYDIDLVCQVLNLTDFANYKAGLEMWEMEKQRQKVEFTITEKDIDADKRLAQKQEGSAKTRPQASGCSRSSSSKSCASSGSSNSCSSASSEAQEERVPSGRLQSLEARTPSPEAELAKYKTLPPIRHQSVDRDQALLQKKQKQQSQFWDRPTAPKPFLVHLGVTARTHDITKFQQNFPDEYHSFYVDRLLSEAGDTTLKETINIEQPEAVVCTEAESDMIAGALMHVIRGLLDDSTFHDAVESIQEEATPYYQQLTTQLPRTVAASPTPSIVVISARDGSEPRSVAGSVRSGTPEDPELLALKDDEEEDGCLPDNMASKACGGTPPPCASQESGRKSVSPEQDLPDLSSNKDLKKKPEFGSTLEAVLENTIANILNEAFLQEFNITARPRLVAMLPRPATPHSSIRH